VTKIASLILRPERRFLAFASFHSLRRPSLRLGSPSLISLREPALATCERTVPARSRYRACNLLRSNHNCRSNYNIAHRDGANYAFRGRLEAHLKQTGPLVNALRQQPTDATLVFIPCPIEVKPGNAFKPLPKRSPTTKAILDKVEVALIAHLSALGYKLLNTALMKMDTIEFDSTLGMAWSAPRLKIPPTR
jgi:hypothetical protein